MKINAETGYSKNVAYLKDFYGLCATYGTNFTPSRASYTVAGMTSLGTKAETLLETFNKADAAYTTNVSLRTQSFKGLNKKLTYLSESMANDETLPELVADVNRVIARIKPVHSKNKPAVKTEAPTEGSSADKKAKAKAQKTFENKVIYFTELIDLLSLNKDYKPAEPELAVASLSTYKDQLSTLNANVKDTEKTLNDLRNTRNDLLTKGPDCLMKVVDGVKLHVKHVFGEKSNQYKQLVKFNFTD